MSLDSTVILQANLQTTILGTFLAHVAGFFAYRRIGNFPGVAAAGYIIPTFAITYGAVFLSIFFFRLDYSRFQAAASFLLCTLWYFGHGVAVRGIEPYRLAVVPGGDVEKLETIPGVNWLRVTSAKLKVHDISGVVADLRANLSQEWVRYITQSALSGIPVFHVKQVRESLTGRVEIEHLSENTLGSLSPNHAYIKIKQAIDWLTAAIALLGLLPFLAAVSVLIRLDSPGPVFFRQERIGYRGQPITVFKFRSMKVSDEEGHDRERAITKVGDARITRLGRYLRRSRIDELPQLLNILRGEMSWIGPRPEAVVLSRWYEEELPFYPYRHIVRPGITGWAQVNQGHVAAVDDVLGKLHYDFYYIKNFSPWLDVVIVLKTIQTIITGFGSK
ncbi:lipopolysaccharide/colanic/teichoic acid biosynthesis glycosyltransferase [Rhodoligotrophos appendicifer]|uniref:sugar transferase n=1 Tax=Rhodoligotrophos appendicifer TaxID=987056 RepID=UPI0011867A3E|nr:sugar transferase [Rhodoligotrophos appendicifer]